MTWLEEYPTTISNPVIPILLLKSSKTSVAMASVVPHLFLFLLLPLVFVGAQTNETQIAIGSSLIAGNASVQPWRCQSDDFAFGFMNLHNDFFLLAIWFYKVPENNIVWFAKANNSPILAPRGSKLELTASNGLVLQNPQGGKIWISEPIMGAVAFGVMDNTGNFLLVDANDESLWESFKYPTDTLLPTQKLEINGVLTSRKSPDSYSLGRFQFRLLEDGNAVLNTINLATIYPYDAYYISGTMDSASSQNSGLQVIFDGDGLLYVVKRNGKKFNITRLNDAYPPKTYYLRATMNFDGVFTVSSYPKSPAIANGSWKDLDRKPDNICLANTNPLGRYGPGTCGYNSICTLKSSGRPSCKCPQGYSLIDQNDEYGSCKPDIIQGCEEGAENSTAGQYQMVDLPYTNWPLHDYEFYNSFNEEDCKRSCLEDCFCVAAVSGETGCWKKKLPLSNGRQDVSIRALSFLKLRKNISLDDFPNTPAQQNTDTAIPKRQKNQATIIVAMSALLGSSMFVIFMLVGLKFLGFLVSEKKIPAETSTKKFSAGCNLFQFKYKDLEKATNGFKEELGRGSCGIVYKGTIEGSPIAVKKLDRMFEEEREKEFRTEVNGIGQTHHKNLVRMLGYCEEGNNRMIVYQFMSNGTLSSFLFNGPLKPSWMLRIQIAYGIARGLSYLHEECNSQIIHCDIKPQNILLDEDYNAKISDFGLAKLLKMDQSRTETGIRGTKGYVAPDWFRSSPVNAKVDVYSFGVLLLEIICCRRNVDMECGGEREVLTDPAYDCYKQGRLDVLIEGDVEAMDDFLRVERFVKIAIWCLQEDPSRRPTMKKALLMLEGNEHVSAPLCPCPFSSIN